jgi:hypothetical protein
MIETAYTRGELIKQGDFVFKIGDHLVCETGFLTMLGFDKAPKPRMWQAVKKRVRDGITESDGDISDKTSLRRMQYHARQYILSFIKRECDLLPDKLVAVVPYVYIKTFWSDYDYACRKLLNTGMVETGQIASYPTFKRAFLQLKSKYINTIYSIILA